LPWGTPEQVREEVRRVIGALGPGGGYILNSVHNIQPDVPLENFFAMFEAAREYGTYPLVVSPVELPRHGGTSNRPKRSGGRIEGQGRQTW